MDNTGITEAENQPMSVGDWMLTIFLTAIPIVGIVMLFVWAFGDGAKISKRNWAKATLIWFGIFIVLYLLFFVVIFSTSGLLE